MTDTTTETTPKTKDLLERGPFIEGLVDTLKNPPSDACQIVAVEGRWGAGKTYVIDKIKSKLENENRILWVDFNPWSFRDKDHLTSLFFAELKRKLPKPKKKYFWSVVLSCIVSACVLSLFYIQFHPYVFGISHFISEVLPLMALVCVPVLLVRPETRQRIPKVWKWIKPLFFSTQDLPDLMSQYADLLEGDSSETSERTLTEIKDQISKELKNCDPIKRIIVAIEDLDRLTAKEVCEVVQFVRMIADFDNVTYLLAYDRDQVVCALGSLSASRTKADREEYGAGFLRRVVERSIPLPVFDRAQLTAIMTDECQKILKNYYGEEAFLTEYWEKISKVVFSLCPTLRESQRVIARADLVAMHIKEISNPADVVLFSYMSEYQGEAWDCLKKNFGKPDYYYLTEKRRQEYEKSPDNPLTHIKEDQKALKPLIEKIDPYSKGGSEDVYFWIGSRGCFPVYISYSSTSVAEGQKEAKRILAHTSNYSDFDGSGIVRENAQEEYYGVLLGVLKEKLTQGVLGVDRTVSLLENLPRIFKVDKLLSSSNRIGFIFWDMIRDVIVKQLSSQPGALALIKRILIRWSVVKNYPISLGIMRSILISNSERTARFAHREIVLNGVSFSNMAGDFQQLYYKQIKLILGMPADAIKTNGLGMHLAVCAALAEGREKDEIRELIEGQEIKTLLLSMRCNAPPTGKGEVEYYFSKTEIESLFWYMGADVHSIIDALLLKVGDDEELQRALRNTPNIPEPAE